MSILPAPFSTPQLPFHTWASTPPMGWNSWDCFGTTVTEAQTRAHTDYMAHKLKAHGWQYIVVDIQWYEPNAKGHDYRPGAELVMDGFGRLLPDPVRFPSARDGGGFKVLADYVHALGLKLGIHLMRGIPRQAVDRNTPVFGTKLRARDIANTDSVCNWNPDMYGGDMTQMDDFTLSLLTNDEVLAVNQQSSNGREILRKGDQIAWIADIPNTSDKYLALFNVGETPLEFPVAFNEIGFDSPVRIRDLWQGTDLGVHENIFATELQPHASGLYRISQ